MLHSSDSEQNINTNHTSSDSPYPDLTSLNRNDLIRNLHDILMVHLSESNQNTNSNHTSSDSLYPDLTSLNRNDLIKSLQNIIRILDVLKQKVAAAQATENEIKELEKKGRSEAEDIPSSWTSPILISAGISGGFISLLMCADGDGSFGAWILCSLILFTPVSKFLKENKK